MLNHITAMGRLTRTPELRRTQTGTAVVSFTLAVQRDFGSGGERETDFLDCVAWGGTGEFVNRYFDKGQAAVVSGRLQIRRWTDKDGERRYTPEITAERVYFAGRNAERDGDEPAGSCEFTEADESCLPF